MRHPHLILNIAAISLILLLTGCSSLQAKAQIAKEKACPQVPKAQLAAQLTRQVLEFLPEGSDTTKAKEAADVAEASLKYLQALCAVE